MKVIMISGKIGSGKNTTAAIIKRLLEEQGYTVILKALAEPLKKAVAYMRGEKEGLFHDRNSKDKDDDSLRRKLLIGVGEVMTNNDSHVFARWVFDAAKEEIGSKKKHILIITDLRKASELFYYQACAINYTIRLKGSFVPYTNPEIAKANIECELDHLDDLLQNDGVLCLGDSISVLKPYCTNSNTGLSDKDIERNKQKNINAYKIIINEAIKILFY